MAVDREHLYADPHVYDVLHDEGTLADAKLFVRLARRFVSRLALAKSASMPIRFFEPACGSGRYLHALAKLGHIGIGLDSSMQMLAYARLRARQLGLGGLVKTVHAPMEKFMVKPRVDLAFNPINSIRHLGTDRAMLAHLACVRRTLRPDGVYVIGLSLAAYGLESPSEDVWVSRRDGLRVTQVVQFEPPSPSAKGPSKRRERVISHLTIEPIGAGKQRDVQHRDSRYWLRTFNRAEWEGIVAKAGWRIEHVCSNTGVACEAREPGYYLFVLRP